MTGSTSHAKAMSSIASALTGAGHQVLVAAPPELAAAFRDTACDVAGVMGDFGAHCRRLDHRPGRIWYLEVTAGPMAGEDFANLLPTATRFRPDLLVRDGGEFAGCLLAEELGLPLVVAPSGVANLLDPAAVLPLLNERRAEIGLPVATDPGGIYGRGRIDCMPPEYSFAARPGDRTLSYRQPVSAESTEAEAWGIGSTPDRPLVLAAFGGVLPMAARLKRSGVVFPDVIDEAVDAGPLVKAVVAALGTVDCTALVAAGAFAVGRPPPNVRVVERFPQEALLPEARLFVTHGGYNSIREAVAAGVPMAVAPRFADQHRNADRVESLGLGKHLRVLEPSAMGAVCRSLLADTSILNTARHAQKLMSELPSLDTLPGDLERIVASRSRDGAV
ncbi:glycosyltransferase [Actinomadura fibrosa]|uniref:Glycosyltransferase n=1 Tax=Actinomadura fibrosa TaxID=111802 RepID=A0ABW2Y1G8_9ACTN|nr:glycosyltransferase [Actinomadura fibrosa]